MPAAPTVFGWAGVGLANGTPGLTLRAASVTSKHIKGSQQNVLAARVSIVGYTLV